MIQQPLNNDTSQRELDRAGMLITERLSRGSGGLNVSDNPIDLPAGDSPDLLNVEYGLNGIVKKRMGTVLRTRALSAPIQAGEWVTSSKGHKMFVGKSGLNLVVIPYLTDSITTDDVPYYAGTISNSQVWSTVAENVPTSTCVTGNPVPSVVFATGSNCVVEVFLYERQLEVASAPVTTFTITDDPNQTGVPVIGLTAANGGKNFTYIINNDDPTQIYRPVTVTNTGTSVAFTDSFTNIVTGSTVSLPVGFYSIIKVIPVYWTQSITLPPECLADYTARFQTSYDTDLALPIKASLIRSIDLDSQTYITRTRNICVASINASTGTYLKLESTLPDASDEFKHAAGGYRGLATDVPVGSTHLAFGDIVTLGGSALPIVVVRLYKNWLGTSINDTKCLVDPYNTFTLVTHDTTATPASYPTGTWDSAKKYLASSDVYVNSTAGFVPTTTGTDIPACFSFGSRMPLGIPYGSASWADDSDLVTKGFVGRASTLTGGSTLSHAVHLASYNRIPVAGLYEFCDFRNTNLGDFGSIIAYYQGRICLSGFKGNNKLVVLSNQKNLYEWSSGVSLFNYNRNFQTWYSDQSLGYNPVALEVGEGFNEKVTALFPTDSALLVFTDRATYAVISASGIFSLLDYRVVKLVSTGTISPKSVAYLDGGVVVFVTPENQVVALLPSQETENRFTTVSLSYKLSNLLEAGKAYSEPTWLAYDGNYKRLFLAFSTYGEKVCNKLFVLNTEVSSWSEFALADGDFVTTLGKYNEGRMFVFTTRASSRTTDSSYDVFDLLEFDNRVTLDYYGGTLKSTLILTQIPVPDVLSFRPYSTNQTYYNFGAANSTGTYSLGTMPVRQLEDFRVFLDSTELTTQYEFKISGTTPQAEKVPNDRNSIVLDNLPSGTFTNVHIHPVATDRTYPFMFYVDNVYLDTVKPTLTFSSSSDTIYADVSSGSVSSINSASKLNWGLAFPCYYKTPVLSLNRPDVRKRYTHVVLFFRNLSVDKYKNSDVNVSAGQTPSAIVDKPKRTYNCGMSVLLDGTFSGIPYPDIYAQSVGQYEFGRDIPDKQRELVTKLTVPLLGTGSSIQLVFYNFDADTWELLGYQLVAKATGRTTKTWGDLYKG